MNSGIINETDTSLHFDAIECYGCEKMFCLTMKDDDIESQRFCETCFGFRFPLKHYMEIIRRLSAIQRKLWSTPVDKLPEELLKRITFINPELNRKYKS